MKYSIALLLGLFATTLLQAQTGNAPKVNWLTQKDSVYHFSFQYPDNWQLKLPGTNTRFFVTSYPENDADNFRENINCIVREMEDTAYAVRNGEAEILKTLSGQLADFKLLNSGYKKWNGKEAMYLEYTCTKKSGDNNYSLHMYQQIVVWRGNLVTLTYTANANSYNKYSDTVFKIIQSIKAD